MGVPNIEGVLAGVRAMLAEELLTRGHSQKDVSLILGITPAAVTLYARGRRGRGLAERIGSVKEASMVVKDLAGQMSERRKRSEGVDEFPLVLDAAYRVMRLVSQENPPPPSNRRRVVDQGWGETLLPLLRSRIEQEQLAAQRNMTLAVATKDELKRILFRQIATDSMRHADILGTIISHLEKPGTRRPSRDDVMQIEAMIREEESATEKPIEIERADPVVRLLLSSIDMDEQKHSRLLKGMLDATRAAIRTKRRSA